MRSERIVGATNCGCLSKRITKINSNLQVTYYHILRKNNSMADKMANKGVKNKLGIVSIREKTYYKHVP